MAYDDDGKLNWGDYESLVSILESLGSERNRLSVSRLAELVDTVHGISRGRASGELSLGEISDELTKSGFGSVSVGMLSDVVTAVAELPADAQASEQITLSQARRFQG